MLAGEIGSSANIVRSCPDEWKQRDGAGVACITHRYTVKTTMSAAPAYGGHLTGPPVRHSHARHGCARLPLHDRAPDRLP
jgi:hypothetical protein